MITTMLYRGMPMEQARWVEEQREAGKPMTEIADELGISISQTYKLARLAAGEGL